METTLNSNADALFQTAASVALIAAAGLVVVPRLYRRVRPRWIVTSALIMILLPLYFSGIAMALALANVFAVGTYLLIVAVVAEPIGLSLSVVAGYLVSQDLAEANRGSVPPNTPPEDEEDEEGDP